MLLVDVVRPVYVIPQTHAALVLTPNLFECYGRRDYARAIKQALQEQERLRSAYILMADLGRPYNGAEGIDGHTSRVAGLLYTIRTLPLDLSSMIVLCPPHDDERTNFFAQAWGMCTRTIADLSGRLIHQKKAVEQTLEEIIGGRPLPKTLTRILREHKYVCE